MGFDNDYGITSIKSNKMESLSISWESDSQRSPSYPVLLYTPLVVDKNTHYHIPLTIKQTQKLRDWLTAFLEVAEGRL